MFMLLMRREGDAVRAMCYSESEAEIQHLKEVMQESAGVHGALFVVRVDHNELRRLISWA